MALDGKGSCRTHGGRERARVLATSRLETVESRFIRKHLSHGRMATAVDCSEAARNIRRGPTGGQHQYEAPEGQGGSDEAERERSHQLPLRRNPRSSALVRAGPRPERRDEAGRDGTCTCTS